MSGAKSGFIGRKIYESVVKPIHVYEDGSVSSPEWSKYFFTQTTLILLLCL